MCLLTLFIAHRGVSVTSTVASYYQDDSKVAFQEKYIKV